MSSPLGLMAPTIINSDAVQGETFLPGPSLEQIESYAPGHQVRFGSLNFMADIRGDRSLTDLSHSRACRAVMMGMI